MIKPSKLHRYVLYITFALLWGSGVFYLGERALRGDLTSLMAPRTGFQITSMIAHGVISFFALLALGSLWEHVHKGWGSQNRRFSGVSMVSVSAILILTALPLYYAGDEVIRSLAAMIHSTAGMFLPLALLWHIFFAGQRKE